jgi:hypothetical protein
MVLGQFVCGRLHFLRTRTQNLRLVAADRVSTNAEAQAKASA